MTERSQSDIAWDNFYERLQHAHPCTADSFHRCKRCRRFKGKTMFSLPAYLGTRYMGGHGYYICEECRIDQMHAYEEARGNRGI